MTEYAIITDRLQMQFLLAGKMECPSEAVMFAQFDDGELVAFQLLQQALFAEGMWAKDARAHLRTLNHMLFKYVDDLGIKPEKLLTMTRSDETGNRIGRLAKYMGYEDTGWKVYRRASCQ